MSNGGGGGGLFGGMIGGMSQAQASKAAAKMAQHAAERALALQKEMYYQTREDLAPWRETGGEAADTLWDMIQAGPGEFEESPYYNFLLSEGVKALERGAAARGNQLSGAQQKALTRYGEDVASTEYQNWLSNWYNSLMPYQNVASLGLGAASQTGQSNLWMGEQGANALRDIGALKGTAMLNLGNIMGESMSSAGQQFGNLLQNYFGRGGGTGNIMGPSTGQIQNWAADMPAGYGVGSGLYGW